MHHQLQSLESQYGATLVLSLLLMAILTLLSTSAMQSSHLSFKTQFSRIGYQKNLGAIDSIQNQAAKKIKDFIAAQAERLDDDMEDLSEGFSLLKDLLVSGTTEYEEGELVWVLTNSLPDMSVDVYISQPWIQTEYMGSELGQFHSYSQNYMNENASVVQYLYLQIHCIAKSKKTKLQSGMQVIGNFRIEV